MAQVVVRVNDRPYTMECDPGTEEQVVELAHLLDGEIVKLKRSVGPVGDIRLLLMGGLVIADKLGEALRRIEELEDEVERMRVRGAPDAGRAIEVRVVERLNQAAERLAALAGEIAPADAA